MSPPVLVTGPTSGLGFHTALALAAANVPVVLAGRDPTALAGTASQLRERTGNRRVVVIPLDLADLASVRSLPDRLSADLGPLGALVCNAGVQVVSGTARTADGFERTFGVNHLGHFLLANLLLDRMAEKGRVVFVSSGTHDPARRTGMPPPRLRPAEYLAFPERDTERAEEPSPGAVGRARYTTSKLCNVLCTYEMDRRARAEGLDLSVNVYDPGAMPGTGLARDWPTPVRAFWNGMRVAVPLLRAMGLPFSTAGKSGPELAQLAVAPRYQEETGMYIEIDRPARSSKESYDTVAAAALWDGSAALVGLSERRLRGAA